MRFLFLFIVFALFGLVSYILYLNGNFLGLLFNELFLAKLFLNESIDFWRQLCYWCKGQINFFRFLSYVSSYYLVRLLKF